MIPVGQAILLFCFTLLTLFIFAWLLYTLFGGNGAVDTWEPAAVAADFPGPGGVDLGAYPEAEFEDHEETDLPPTILISPAAAPVPGQRDAFEATEAPAGQPSQEAAWDRPASVPEAEQTATAAPTEQQPGAALDEEPWEVPEEPEISLEPRRRDDLKRIEGIGPVMEAILNEVGILTFADLAACSPERLQKILDAAGISYAVYSDTWPEQAKLAAEGRWEELEALQRILRGNSPWASDEPCREEGDTGSDAADVASDEDEPDTAELV